MDIFNQIGGKIKGGTDFASTFIKGLGEKFSGYYKWQEENIAMLAGLADLSTRAAYMSVIYVSAQN